MSRREPVIELEPRNPFSWKMVAGFVGLWVVALAAALFLKGGIVRLLMPLVALLFVIYLAVCTLVYLKRRK